MGDNKQMSEEDYLRQHIESREKNNNSQEFSNQLQDVDSNTITNLQYLSFDVKDLPCGRFYPSGTILMVRAAQVREIQSYSMVDDNNFYDIVEKMNGMLQSCVRVKYPDGKISSFLDVKDQDRLYLIFLIRELTFQQGSSLAVTVKGPSGEDTQIELIRSNFKFHDQDIKIEKYFSKAKNAYVFRTISGKEFELTPPNIGLQKAFTDYIIKENNENRPPNLAFLKIIPFMLSGRTTITYDGIKSKLQEFEQMDDISFQFLNAAVSKMTFGIKELFKEVDGQEVRADMQFPNGASGIFVIHDAFEAFIEK
jgi:hypothetical protein